MNVAVEASVLSSMSELDLEFHLWGGGNPTTIKL